MNKLVLFCIIVFVLAIGISNVYGQAASGTWALTTDGSAVATGNVTASAEVLAGLVTSTKATWGPVVSVPGFPSTVPPGQTAPISSNYVQFAVAPTAGNTFVVSTVSMYLGFSGTNNGQVEVDFSTNSGTTFSALTTALAIPSTMGLGNPFTFTLPTSSNSVASGQSFLVNIYPWLTGTASVGTGKYLLPQNVVISGTTSGGTYVANEEGTSLAPKKLTLTNYPNPFNPSTTIQFTVKETGMASVKVYNVVGQLITTLFNGQVQAGEYHTATFGGNNFASGVYFYSIESGGERLVKKMLMLK